MAPAICKRLPQSNAAPHVRIRADRSRAGVLNVTAPARIQQPSLA
jgi:hypothetical protein